MLTGGLILSGVAICVAALLPGYWFFLIGYALLGVANTVYHPADYSILSARSTASAWARPSRSTPSRAISAAA